MSRDMKAPRLAVRVQDIRDAIAHGQERGSLSAGQVDVLAGMLVALERQHPGATLLPLDGGDATTLELEAATASYLAHRRALEAERDRARWPQCAAGPCAAGPEGLVLPESVPSRAAANEILAQLVSTRGLRELTSREKDAFRALRRQGISQPSSPHEFAAIAKNRLRQLSKAAKRARNAQRTMEGARAAAKPAGEEVAC
jgi:hypothetical protein